MKCCVLGGGSWGTALASVLAGKGYPVQLYARNEHVVSGINTQHENTQYLAGFTLPLSLVATTSLEEALKDAELIVFAVPSASIRSVVKQASVHIAVGTPIVAAAKGIEVDTLMTVNEVLEDVLPTSYHPYLTFLGGPSFAKEVVKRMPTAVTIAGWWPRVTAIVQAAFTDPSFFRVYTDKDIIGCEIGGVVKNVIAIATGCSDGMGFGANARAALITRGLSEIQRLAVRLGANPLTTSGLTGMGDLVLTCSSNLSRNYRVGFGLGQGKTLEQVQVELGQVAEGVFSAKSVILLARKHGVEMPITEQVYKALYETLTPAQAMLNLMGRTAKTEFYH